MLQKKSVSERRSYNVGRKHTFSVENVKGVSSFQPSSKAVNRITSLPWVSRIDLMAIAWFSLLGIALELREP